MINDKTKKRILPFLLIVFFFVFPFKAQAYCCGILTVKHASFELEIGIVSSLELLVAQAIVAQGLGIQEKLGIINKGLQMAIKDWAGYISTAYAEQEDERRKAEFAVNQQLEQTFGLGINPVNMPYKGLVIAQEVGRTFRMDMLPKMGRTQYGTKYADTSKDASSGGGRQVQNDVRAASEKYKDLFVVDPPNGTYTPEQSDAAQRVFTLLADPFPVAWPFDFEKWKDTRAGEDFKGLMVMREKEIEALQRIAFLNWMEWHLPVVDAPQWYEQTKTSMGYTRKPEITGKLSLRTFHEINATYFNSVFFRDEALRLTKKGLLQELLKIQSYRNSMKQEILTEWKKISMQVVFLNPENRKQIEETMNAIKTVRE